VCRWRYLQSGGSGAIKGVVRYPQALPARMVPIACLIEQLEQKRKAAFWTTPSVLS
jgi:hypothetical protein